MPDTPQIIRTRRGAAAPREFTFTADQVVPVKNSAYLSEYRRQAWEAFQATAMPTTQDEPWRRTDLRQLHPELYQLPAVGAYLDLAPIPDELLQPLTDKEHGGQIVLLPGGSQIRLDPELAAKGVIFTDLRTAEQQYPQILEKIAGKVVKPSEGKFAGLAGALAQNGVLLYIPRNVEVNEPLHSLLWGPGVNLAHVSHILVWLDEGASATYVHESASPSEVGQTLHSGIVELHVGAGANLRFVELQWWGEGAWNFTHERAEVDRDGNL